MIEHEADHHYLPWARDRDNPTIPGLKGTWRSWTANPDMLLLGDTYFLYYRGQGGDGKDRIGVMTVKRDRFDGKTFEDYSGNPILDVGAEGTFDSGYVLDPAIVVVDGRIYLYYSGISSTRQEGRLPDSIGLAVSDDGFRFRKFEGNPLFPGRAPEVVCKDGKFHMLYQKSSSLGYFIAGDFRTHLAMSEDGYRFVDYGSEPVFQLGGRGAYDARAVTARIFFEDGVYLMLYACDPVHFDYPRYLGLAASRDLIHWKKYPRNPVFSRGESGQWDEGGIWFPTFLKERDTYYMWYEGFGGGKDRDKPFDAPGSAQIGLATLKGTSLRALFPDV